MATSIKVKYKITVTVRWTEVLTLIKEKLRFKNYDFSFKNGIIKILKLKQFSESKSLNIQNVLTY